MKSGSTIKELIEEWFAFEAPAIIPRDIGYELSESSALALLGPRRAGKTYFMFWISRDLMRKGWPRESIVYMNFEDVRLVSLKPGDFSTFLKAVNELSHPHKGRVVLLLDEVQNLQEWGRWVRTLLDRRRYYVILTGSSSKLRASEISTELRGRYIDRLVLPFSFREFLRARGFEAKYLGAPERMGELLSQMRDYVTKGGLPEVVLKPELAKDIVRTYKQTIMYRDVVERHKIRDVSSFETFLELVEESFGKYLSVSRLSNYFKSLGIAKSKKTLVNYLKFLEECFYVIPVRRFAFSRRASIQQPRKIYPVDTAYFRRIELGSMMESVVAVELMRRGADFFYYKDIEYEVDFVIEQPRELVQVTYASSFDEIDRREIRALLKARDALGKGKLKVITWDLEDSVEKEGIKIELIPLWKWLLEGQ